jgi:hypothetical protein
MASLSNVSGQTAQKAVLNLTRAEVAALRRISKRMAWPFKPAKQREATITEVFRFGLLQMDRLEDGLREHYKAGVPGVFSDGGGELNAE